MNRWALVAVCALVLAACEPVPATDDSETPTASPTMTAGIRCGPPYPPEPATAETVFCADPSTLESARVVRIVDGDTLRAMVDGVEEPVRFYGIDTTERGEACYREATQRTRELAGDDVLLRPDARNRDRSQRLLRYVYTTDGLSIDALLVAEGLAYAWRDDGALRVPLIALEDLARALGKGCLWSNG
jgi:micrococcal nuclease